MHFLHVQKTTYEAFEEVLGGSGEIWRYTHQNAMLPGQVLVHAREYDANLYLVQTGRLSAWIRPHRDSEDSNFKENAHLMNESSGNGDDAIRICTFSRGSIINHAVLVGEAYAPHDIIVDRPTVVLVITPSKMARMELEKPKMFIRLLRTVLFSESAKLCDLEAERDAFQHDDTFKERMKEVRLTKEKKATMHHFKSPINALYVALKKKLPERIRVLEKVEKDEKDEISETQIEVAHEKVSLATAMEKADTKETEHDAEFAINRILSDSKHSEKLFKISSQLLEDSPSITKLGSQVHLSFYSKTSTFPILRNTLERREDSKEGKFEEETGFVLNLPRQVADTARLCFKRRVRYEKRKLRSLSRGSTDTKEPLLLPTSAIKDTIMLMGLYPARKELNQALNDIMRARLNSDGDPLGLEKGNSGSTQKSVSSGNVSLEEFLLLVGKLVFRIPTEHQLNQYRSLYNTLNDGKELDEKNLTELLLSTNFESCTYEDVLETKAAVSSLMQRWSDHNTAEESDSLAWTESSRKTMNFCAFVSMMSYNQKQQELDEDVFLAFREWCNVENCSVNTKALLTTAERGEKHNVSNKVTFNPFGSLYEQSEAFNRLSFSSQRHLRGCMKRAESNESFRSPKIATKSLQREKREEYKGREFWAKQLNKMGMSCESLEPPKQEYSAGEINGSAEGNPSGFFINLNNIKRGLQLHSPTISTHAIKWSMSYRSWSSRWIDLHRNTILWHDFDFANSENLIEITEKFSVYTYDEAMEYFKNPEARPEGLGVVVPADYAREFDIKNTIVLKCNESLETVVFIPHSKVAAEWVTALRIVAKYGCYEPRERRLQLEMEAREMLWEGDPSLNATISFDEFLECITLVHEDEVEKVLEDESARILLTKAKFLDPWMDAMEVAHRTMSTSDLKTHNPDGSRRKKLPLQWLEM
eukprot:g1932.t1